MMSRKLTCMFLSFALLGACSSELPATRHYLLAMPEAAAQGSASNSLSVQIAPVLIPPYLNQQGIVLVDDDRQVAIARFNLWAEPLDLAIARQLRNTLTDDGASPVASLYTTINYFHGEPAGRVILDASWQVEALECENSHSGRFVSEIRQDEPGYASLTDAHAGLLERFAEEIREQVESLDDAACEP